MEGKQLKKLMVGMALTATLATAVTPGFGSIGEIKKRHMQQQLHIK